MYHISVIIHEFWQCYIHIWLKRISMNNSRSEFSKAANNLSPDCYSFCSLKVAAPGLMFQASYRWQVTIVLATLDSVIAKRFIFSALLVKYIVSHFPCDLLWSTWMVDCCLISHSVRNGLTIDMNLDSWTNNSTV